MTPEHERPRKIPAQSESEQVAHDRPLDEAQKSYHTVLEQQVKDAKEELERPASALLLSAFAAGMDLGFGPLAIAVGMTLTKDVFSKPAQELLSANLYSVGFIFVIIGRSALFTEHTTSAVQPVLSGRATVAQLLRLWGLVLVANIAGGALFALGAVWLGPALHVVDPAVFGELAKPLVDKPSTVIFASAIAAGWIMGLLSWLVIAVRDTVSQLIVIWLSTMVIGLLKLHHSIAGSTEVLMSVFAGMGATPADYGRFIIFAVAGNAVGGAVFVALLKFGSVYRSKE